MQPQCRREARDFRRLQRASCAAGVGLLCLVLPIGCEPLPTFTDPPRRKPYTNLTLRLSVPDEASRRFAEHYATVWSARSGAKVIVEIGPFATSHDLALIAPFELPRFAAEKRLRPVPSSLREFGNKYDWLGIIEFWRDTLLTWEQGEPVALPVLGEGEVLVVRRDLLQGDKLPRPDTWETVQQLAHHFRLPSLPPLSTDDAALERRFFQIAASYDRQARTVDQLGENIETIEEKLRLLSFHYDTETGMPRLNAPAFVRALTILQDLAKCSKQPPVADPVAQFRAGESLLAFATLREVATLADSPVRHVIDILPLPGTRSIFVDRGESALPAGVVNRVPYLGSAGLVGVVSADSTAPDAAFEFLAELSSPIGLATEIAMTPHWGAGCYRALQIEGTSRGNWLAYNLDKERTEQLLEAVRAGMPLNLTNPAQALRIPDEAPKRTLLREALRRAVTVGGDPQSILNEVVLGWQKLDQSIPADVRLRNYLLSVGITPRR